MDKDITKRQSKSKLLIFKQCPKKYWFQQNYPLEFKQTPQMKRGSDIHDLFEEFELNRIENNLKKFSQLKNFKEEYIPQIKMFLSNFLAKYKSIVPESVEGKIYSESQDIVIKWDRIDYCKGTRIIWDYKSGKFYEGSQFINKFKFELMIYAFIYMLETKKRIDYVGIYFIDHGKTKLIKVDNEDVQWIIKEIFELKLQMKDYQNTGIWPEKYSYVCKWCDYKNKCSSYKRFNKNE